MSVDLERKGAYQVQSIFPLVEFSEDLTNLVEIGQVAGNPFDLGFITGFFFDGVYRGLALVFLAVDDNDSG